MASKKVSKRISKKKTVALLAIIITGLCASAFYLINNKNKSIGTEVLSGITKKSVAQIELKERSQDASI